MSDEEFIMFRALSLNYSEGDLIKNFAKFEQDVKDAFVALMKEHFYEQNDLYNFYPQKDEKCQSQVLTEQKEHVFKNIMKEAMGIQ